MKVLILSARTYDFEDNQSSKRVQGVTVNYVEGEPETASDRRGVFPLTISAASEVWGNLRELPGIYEADFRQRPGKNNRPTLMLTGVKFLAPARLLDTLETAA
jgi:hypothetical protein